MKLKKAQMFQQYFDPEKDQENAAEPFCGVFVSFSESETDEQTGC